VEQGKVEVRSIECPKRAKSPKPHRQPWRHPQGADHQRVRRAAWPLASSSAMGRYRPKSGNCPCSSSRPSRLLPNSGNVIPDRSRCKPHTNHLHRDLCHAQGGRAPGIDGAAASGRAARRPPSPSSSPCSAPAPNSDAKSSAARHRARRAQNRAVAKFCLGPCYRMGDETRVHSTAAILAAAANDFDVDWPSTLLH
jgi:hypothetical protein